MTSKYFDLCGVHLGPLCKGFRNTEMSPFVAMLFRTFLNALEFLMKTINMLVHNCVSIFWLEWFFCDFSANSPPQCVEKDSTGSIIFPTANQLENNVLSIYFQMPVLFYLDFEIRAGLMAALRSATNSSNLCIYRHQDMRVSYFEEG